MNKKDIALTYAGLMLFGLTLEDISETKIVEAYRRFARTVHPDVCRGPEAERLMKLGTEMRDFLLQALVGTRPAPEPEIEVVYYGGWGNVSTSTGTS